ncbi:probable DNA helicase MCM9 [Lolium perenne]|uniref:probable DNA helicase MCM9 n=1 Tax=Lolium perenne TaxID=4522 RepID=UPI003A9A45C2
MPPPLSDDLGDAAELSGYEPMLAKFLRGFHSDDLRRILLHSEPTLHFPLVIDFAELFDFDTELGNALYSNPRTSSSSSTPPLNAPRRADQPSARHASPIFPRVSLPSVLLAE